MGVFQVRISDELKAAMEAQAAAEGVSLTEWARRKWTAAVAKGGDAHEPGSRDASAQPNSAEPGGAASDPRAEPQQGISEPRWLSEANAAAPPMPTQYDPHAVDHLLPKPPPTKTADPLAKGYSQRAFVETIPRLPSKRPAFQRRGEKPAKGTPCFHCSCSSKEPARACRQMNCECHTGVAPPERMASVAVTAPEGPVAYERCRKCMAPLCTEGKCWCSCHGAWRAAQGRTV